MLVYLYGSVPAASLRERKRVIRIVGTLLISLLTACSVISGEILTPYQCAVAAADFEQSILVTFKDRSIGRAAFPDPELGFASRGVNYRNSTYSQSIMDGLERDYGLEIVSHWAATTMGFQTVVYRVKAGIAVHEVINLLSRDDRVSGVQKLQRFRVLSNYRPSY